MQSDFTFVLHCAKCGLDGEIEEYTLRHRCPECGSEMRLSRIDAKISGEALRNRLRELVSKKEQGDDLSGRILALLADSSDPEVRKLLDEVLEEKYRRDHGIARPRPMVKLDPEGSQGRGGGTETVTTYTCADPRASLTSATIPSSVTSIGARAFHGCENLTNVTIPEGVTSIGARAFERCESLTNVTIPSSVTTIGRNAFAGCSLTGVTIPSSVTSIGGGAFAECRNLTSVTIPEGVTSIGEGAFAGCSLTSATIPSSVTSIGGGAFERCGKIEVSLDNRNFYTHASGALIDRKNGKLLYFPPRFSGEYTIPAGVTYIGSGAFWWCPCEESVKKQFPKYR